MNLVSINDWKRIPALLPCSGFDPPRRMRSEEAGEQKGNTRSSMAAKAVQAVPVTGREWCGARSPTFAPGPGGEPDLGAGSLTKDLAKSLGLETSCTFKPGRTRASLNLGLWETWGPSAGCPDVLLGPRCLGKSLRLACLGFLTLFPN